ncbi:hypothetical protein FA13DRAFT_1716139 [Coprinellus micaceus]|uniref:RRM domain-containing protein n=1 Tax=Coprinellus micaceus TaxID=71717 RepID=A0A4Y7SKK2_COPMI|nr:hypothetical protein FA13DRAFT_1716139 [Coprinellus micaceus]
MNTPPRSPSPSPASIRPSKPMNAPAQQESPSRVGDMPPTTSPAKANPPHRLAHAGPDRGDANDATLRVDWSSGPMGVEESEQDKEAVSSNSASSEEVEIYLNDFGAGQRCRIRPPWNGVWHAQCCCCCFPLLPRTFVSLPSTSATVATLKLTPIPLSIRLRLHTRPTYSPQFRTLDEPSAADSPLLPRGRVFNESHWSRRTTTSSSQEPGAPLLTPVSRDSDVTPLSSNTRDIPKGAAISTPISNTTSDITIDAGPTTNTTSDTNSGLPSTPTLCPSRHLHSLDIRNQLLSPVGDPIDSPIIPPATRMITVPLPDMDDHDDPTSLLPRSMEQMNIQEAHSVSGRSAFDRARARGLTLGNGGTMAMVDSTGGSRSGSIPSTPAIGIQPSSSYTQSQPLPQLPTFAPGLSVIDEGGPRLSKDDLHLDLVGDGRREEYAGRYGGEGDELQMNRAESNQQRQNPNVTILPVYQQYGTITVSNSVVSFPNSPPATAESTTGTTASSNDFVQDLSTQTSSTSFSGQQKTPNVYINGLPPHFPEEQLEALTAPFGEVKSVRTFTRHVRDSESGYGFVLFGSIEAAERCIIALRKYRNLHPTFSKQVHKIPGTIYANSNTNNQGDGSFGGFHSASESEDGDATFKARMEALGRPDEHQLALSALVSPHRVISNRFFQTRLSNPPRIIAFVRLETRAGAEEVIERLHGKMVRGWNDTGSRISRQERSFKEGETDGEPSPGQLTIAQAALLNLRGQDLRIIGHPSPTSPPGVCALPSVTSNLAMNPPVIGSTTQRVVGWGNASVSGISGREIIGSSREPGPGWFETWLEEGVLRVWVTGLAVSTTVLPSPGAPLALSGLYLKQQLRQYQDVLSDGMGGMDVQNPFQMDYATTQRESASMGQQMRRLFSNPWVVGLINISQDYYRMQLEHSSPFFLRPEPQPGEYQSASPVPELWRKWSCVDRHWGITPAEEYIMRAHVENVSMQMDIQQHPSAAQRKRPSPLDLGRQGYRMQASLVGMSDEEAFHAHARAEREAEHTSNSSRWIRRASTSSRSITMRLPGRRPSPISNRTSTSTGLSAGNSGHDRSANCARHYQHNSMSIRVRTAQRTPQHASVATMGGQMEQQQAAGQKLSYRTSYGGQQQQQQHAGSQGYEDSLSHSPTTPSTDSSSLISPALTYSSQHTPSTLSPATPFFGSFGNQGDAFRGAGVVEGKGPIEHGKPHSLKTRIA